MALKRKRYNNVNSFVAMSTWFWFYNSSSSLLLLLFCCSAFSVWRNGYISISFHSLKEMFSWFVLEEDHIQKD